MRGMERESACGLHVVLTHTSSITVTKLISFKLNIRRESVRQPTLDNSTDMSRSDDLSAFVQRPTDITRLIDFMVQASPVASKIDPQRLCLLHR